MPGRSTPSRITRRRLLAASGVTLAAPAPAAFAACGATAEEDEGSPERDAEILNQVLAAQLALVQVVDPASSGAPAEIQPSLDRLNTIRQKSAKELEAFIAEAGGTASAEPAGTETAESAVEAVARQLEVTIETALGGIGDISAEAYRQAVHRYVTEDAAALAALRSTLGEEVAPDSFVFGPPLAEEEGT